MPFAGYADFDACVDANRDKDSPDAYCGSIKHKVEDKAMRKAKQRLIRRPEDLLGAVRKATAAVSGDPVDSIVKALNKQGTGAQPTGEHQHTGAGQWHPITQRHSRRYPKATTRNPSIPYQRRPVSKALSGPVAEAGDKKPTPAIEGAQDDQAFAVAHGPDNYDALTKKAQALAYLPIFKAMNRIIAKQGMAQMNVPGNLKEHLQKALAAVHGREVFDARYEQACKLLKKVCDLMDDIERTAEGAQGGSAAMVQ